MLAPLALSFNQSPILAIPASLNDLVSSGLELKMDWQSGLVYLTPFLFLVPHGVGCCALICEPSSGLWTASHFVAN